MVSGEVDELWFNIRHGVMKPGKNTYRVTCEVHYFLHYEIDSDRHSSRELILILASRHRHQGSTYWRRCI